MPISLRALAYWHQARNFLFRQLPARTQRTIKIFNVVWLALLLMPFILVWVQPFVWFYSSLALVVVNIIIWWWHWTGFNKLRSWLVGGITFMLWSWSLFSWWFFLEDVIIRLFFLVFVAVISFWYLWEWHQSAKKVLTTVIGAGPNPTLIVGLLTVMGLTASAQYLLILFGWQLWLLTLLFFLPQIWFYSAWLQSSGWSLVKHWRPGLFGVVLLWQVFVLVLWWPSGPALAGLISALVYLLVILSVRQEAQGFINYRLFRREIALIFLIGLLALFTARWL
ncbi:MAG: hypothetical protein WC621_04585 [Patescibacteria group bacterium]